jgi:hypothetical protein
MSRRLDIWVGNGQPHVLSHPASQACPERIAPEEREESAQPRKSCSRCQARALKERWKSFASGR